MLQNCKRSDRARTRRSRARARARALYRHHSHPGEPAPPRRQALSNWRPGVVAALSGPDAFVHKVRGVLLANGFPETEIVSL